MYEYLSGKLTEKNPAFAILENNGIGYLVNISLNTYTRIKDQETTTLFIHFVVREDAQILYGFAEASERELFRQLLTVSGVGASTARLILSSLSTQDIYAAISREDASVLQSVKGVGGKTAQRIIVDLKDKLSKADTGFEKVGVTHNTMRDEALSGLLILGFNKTIASRAVDRILKSGSASSVEDLIKQALKVL